MQEQNKNNAIFLGGLFLALATVFFTVVMLTYVGKGGLWSAILPVVSVGYGIYNFVKKFWAYKDGNNPNK